MEGRLFGIGVGPGAPDLLTLRAVFVLSTIDVILSPVRSGNESSKALSIAAPYIAKDCTYHPLDFPMTKDTSRLHDAWNQAATQCIAFIESGKKVAFLTLGDPLTFSTFIYLMRTVKTRAPHIPVTVIPGITSYHAAAAKLCLPLCEGDEHLHILSGIAESETLAAELAHGDTAVILKAYRNIAAIREALHAQGRDHNVWQVRYVEQEEEEIRCGVPQDEPPYMTLLISKP
ncbi:MAG: precorrin-2 C(20)-methyltransferase [Desulfovibrio sp.]|nr:precorrin-2 C(20)-methyltransferase [Desulfovibrio sp.]